jgi:hypothetical protein
MDSSLTNLIERGVKQGCPLPLLSTEPSMLILKEQLEAGQVKGIDIGGGQQMLFQLFADNIRLFSRQLRTTTSPLRSVSVFLKEF